MNESALSHSASPEWTNLLHQATKICQVNSSPLPLQAADEMLWETDQLKGDILDTARYHGLEIIGCHLAAMLRTDDVRSKIVNNAAFYLAQSSLEDDAESQGLRVNDLLEDTSDSAVHLISGIRSMMDAPTNLLNDSLQVSASTHPLVIKDNEKDIANANAIRSRFDGSGRQSVEFMCDSLLAATQLAFWHSYQASIPEQTNPLLRDVAVNTSAVLKVGMYTAKLRFDEFADNGTMQKLVGLDADGEVVFNRSLVSDVADLPKATEGSTPVLHQDRLACPAFRIIGLIPTVVRLFPEITATADEMLLSRAA